MIHSSTPLLLCVVQKKRRYRVLQLFNFYSDELRSQVSVFPILGAIASELPWEGEGPNLAEHYASDWLQGA